MLRLGENEADYTIYSRDYDYSRINEVEDWQALNIVLKWDDISTWALDLPTKEYMKRWDLIQTTPAKTLLAPNKLMIEDSSRPSDVGDAEYLGGQLGIMVFRNGTGQNVNDAILTGIITEVTREWNGSEDKIHLTGESDSYWLRTRVSFPDPSHTVDNYGMWDGGGGGSDVYPGQNVSLLYESETIEYIMQDIISENLGDSPTCLSWRKLPYFTTYWPLHDPQQGDVKNYDTRWETLYDMCKTVVGLQATSFGTAPDGRYVPISYGFAIEQVSETNTTDGRIQYNFLIPEDKKDRVMFGTEFGNVRSFEYTEKRPDYNNVIMGGPTVGDQATGYDNASQRVYYLYPPNMGDPSNKRFGRIESFEDVAGDYGVDAADTNTKRWADIYNEAGTLTFQHRFNQEVRIDLLPEEMEQFQDHFNLGDYVTVELGNFYSTLTVNTTAQRYCDFIRQVSLNVSPDGEIITPIISDPMKWLWTSTPAVKKVHEHERRLQHKGRKGCRG